MIRWTRSTIKKVDHNSVEKSITERGATDEEEGDKFILL